MADSEDESSDSAWARGRSLFAQSAPSLPDSNTGESAAEIPHFTRETANLTARSVHDSILRHGQVSTKLPWEQGAFASIFSSTAMSSFDYQCVQPLLPVIVERVQEHPLKSLAPRVMAGALKRITLTSWPLQQEAQRHKALLRWRMILEENLDCSALGLQLQQAAANLESDASMAEIVAYSFADKATGTLTKRGTPILKFLLWHRKCFGISGLPFQEVRAYEYMKKLRAEGCKPTVWSSLLSAFGFAWHVLTTTGADSVCSSLRIKGLAHSHYLTKKPLRQAKTLTTTQAKMIEDLVRCAVDPMDRIAAGFFCRTVAQPCTILGFAKVSQDHQRLWPRRSWLSRIC